MRDGQVLAGVFGPNIAACCPQGVYVPTPEQLCGCVDNGSESPYALSQLHPTTDASTGATTFHFMVTAIAAVHNPSITLTDCTGMDLDRIRVYINPAYFNLVASVAVAGSPANFTYSSDGQQYWLEVNNLAIMKPSVGTQIDMDVVVSQRRINQANRQCAGTRGEDYLSCCLGPRLTWTWW